MQNLYDHRAQIGPLVIGLREYFEIQAEAVRIPFGDGTMLAAIKLVFGEDCASGRNLDTGGCLAASSPGPFAGAGSSGQAGVGGANQTAVYDDVIHDRPDDGLDPEALVLQQQVIERVQQAVQELPADFREVIVLRELEGLSYKEIAAVAGIPIGTVMSRLARARERLQVDRRRQRGAVETHRLAPRLDGLRIVSP